MKKTPLFACHQKAKAKFVDFFGWEMPLQYQGILQEHLAVRKNMGVFDVSHMGEFFVQGAEAQNFLNFVSSNQVGKMGENQVIYTTLLNNQGGIVDDCTLYKLEAQKFLLVVNAANMEKDFLHLKNYTSDFQVNLENASDRYSLLALQGPNSPTLLRKLVNTDCNSLHYYRFREVISPFGKLLIARLGYTGEDGFEIMLENAQASKFWEALFEHGIPMGLEPIGLGARDTLRLEAGYPLYGQDLKDETTPLEANLGWVLKLEKEKFLGKEKLTQQSKEGVQKKLIAFRYQQKGIPRKDYLIFDSSGGKGNWPGLCEKRIQRFANANPNCPKRATFSGRNCKIPFFEN